MRKMAVEKTGNRPWTRYLIHDDAKRYWTGSSWAENRRSALLFHCWNEASHAYRRLEEEQWSGVPAQDFQAIISVRVWAGQDFTAEQLQDYMHKAVRILLDHDSHGSGPVPESLVRVEVDWATLNETQPGSDR